MQRFDILDPATPILGKRFLEASAGTGKTFAIEHLFVRLLQESDVQLPEILVVTFTRAATRELKMRIRAALEKRSEKKVQKALLLFDQAQIFTIHGFCQRLLSELAFEAGSGFDLQQWTPQEEKEEFDLFLEKTFSSGRYSASQIENLLRYNKNDLDLVRQQVLKISPSKGGGLDFQDLRLRCEEILQHLPSFSVLEDFAEARKNYRRITDPDFALQAEILDRMVQTKSAQELDDLLRLRPFFLQYTAPGNRKVKGGPLPRLEELHARLFPLLEEASHPKKLQQRLARDFEEYRRENEAISPDDLLLRVQEALKTPAFLAQVQKRYRAVVIDEFQDTDPVQWEIFDTLFGSADLAAFYLVGDPKQSIYAFRKADVYTFLTAGKKFGKEAHAYLDTNYRSEQGLVAQLNALFSDKEWMDLPQWNTTLSIPASRAAKEGEGRLLFLVTAPDEESYFPFIVHEITRLQVPLESIAILVKDRYQAKRIQQFLQAWNIPSSQQRKEELTSIPHLRDFLSAVLDPLDISAVKKALLGPFAQGLSRESFFDLRAALLDKGFAAFYAPFLGRSEMLDAVAEKLAVQPDASQLLEMLALFEKMGLEERLPSACHGVQILTIHASKGLEFDTVFAIGLAAPASAYAEEDPELEAEKMRQLYVAMTRAKSRLYVPLPRGGDGTSPIERFWDRTSPDLQKFSSLILSEMTFDLKPWPSREEKILSLPTLHASPFYLLSFSALSEKKLLPKNIPAGILPAGAETGVIIHKIFEQVFTCPLKELVRKEVAGTLLQPWEDEIIALVEKTLALPELQGLGQAPKISEVEFLFPHSSGGLMKGFIDLCFERDGQYYIVDWKTNWLPDYTQEHLRSEMEQGDYFFQASIYADAMSRHLKQKIGGALYVFVRGPAVYSFQPR